MAHYFFFLSIVNNCLFFVIACIYAKVMKVEFAPSQYKKLSFFDKASSILSPLVCWLCIRYKYHFKHILVTGSLSTMISPITYLYNMVKPGTILFMFISALWLSDYNEIFLSNRHLGHSLYTAMANNTDNIQCHRNLFKCVNDYGGISKRKSRLDTSSDWYSLDGDHSQ